MWYRIGDPVHRGGRNHPGNIHGTLSPWSVMIHAPSYEFAYGTLGLAVGAQEPSSAALSASKTVQIIVEAINDGPALMGPLTIKAEEDTPIALTGVAVQDPDCDDAPRGVLEITVAASNGTVRFVGSVAGLYLMEALPGSLKVRGKTGPVNAALAGLTYEGVAEFSGTDRIVVTADDLGHSGTGSQRAASWSIEVLVSASNDPPLIQAPPELDLIAGGVLFAVEDEASPLGVFGVSDIDDAFLRVTVSARIGNIGRSGIEEVGMVAVASRDKATSADDGSSVSFEGTADEVSDALGSLTYTSSLNWNSAAYGRDVVEVSHVFGNPHSCQRQHANVESRTVLGASRTGRLEDTLGMVDPTNAPSLFECLRQFRNNAIPSRSAS